MTARLWRVRLRLIDPETVDLPVWARDEEEAEHLARGIVNPGEYYAGHEVHRVVSVAKLDGFEDGDSLDYRDSQPYPFNDVVFEKGEIPLPRPGSGFPTLREIIGKESCSTCEGWGFVSGCYDESPSGTPSCPDCSGSGLVALSVTTSPT